MEKMKMELVERVAEVIKGCEEDLKSGNTDLAKMVMSDIIGEMYYNYGGERCDELDEIFLSIGWIDEDGETVFENIHRYTELMK